jgi:hypothetical protein
MPASVSRKDAVALSFVACDWHVVVEVFFIPFVF